MIKPLLVAAITAASICATYAQNYKQSGTSAKECAPDNVEFVSAEGDYNKDGIKDLVIALKNSLKFYSFGFYVGNTNGKYSLSKTYDLTLSDNIQLSINDKGVIRIQNNISDGFDVFLFRYQDGELILIGGKEDRHKRSHYDISYNYLTGKMIRTDGEGAAKKSETIDMPELPKLKFGWFPLEYEKLTYLTDTEYGTLDKETITAYGIYKLMQHHNHIWYHHDWANVRLEKDKPGTWSAEDIHEKPYCYNHDSYVTIKKLNDGTYSITEDEYHQDRGYEAETNEDLSNLEEVMENWEYENYERKSLWIFNDGQIVKKERNTETKKE